MQEHNTTPNNSLNSQSKDNEKRHKSQLKRFYQYLQRNTVTCSMASKALKIPQKCLTRYKRSLEKSGLLWEVKKAYCEHTGFLAHYLTTNRDKAPIIKVEQLKMF